MLRQKQSIGDPIAEYDSMLRHWRRSRAIIGGEIAAKDHDLFLDNTNYTNLLIPFSPTMSMEQYRWYVAEAELPGLTSQYSKILVGGLLRKSPSITLPESVPNEAEDWLRNYFTGRNTSLIAFLDDAIDEELKTGHCAISVDFPSVDDYQNLDLETRQNLRPFPIIWKAEEIINWQVGTDRSGKEQLTRVIFRYVTEEFTDNQYHGNYVINIADHALVDGRYQVQYWRKVDRGSVVASAGTVQHSGRADSDGWESGDMVVPLMGGEPLNFIPVFFLNGSIQPTVPILTPLVDREVALYNKVSRRNHLLYGAATYTPVIYSDMSDDNFREIVNAGLGSWIRLGQEDKADVLKTPTDALVDMDRAIESGIADMSRLGIRILAPESRSGDSGVALEIRNSAQTAQLAVLNTRISQTMREVIKVMLQWKYGRDIDLTDLDFTLSADFNPSPLGAEWLRLITEWYQARIIPRSAFIEAVKHHDLLPSDYNDDNALAEIGEDPLVETPLRQPPEI
jgi:hypothetical protein